MTAVANVALRDCVRFRSMGDECVVLVQDDGKVLLVNELGGLVLQMLREGVPVVEIPGRIAAEFEVEEAVAARDVAEYLASLRDNGVVVEV